MRVVRAAEQAGRALRTEARNAEGEGASNCTVLSFFQLLNQQQILSGITWFVPLQWLGSPMFHR